MVTQAHVRTRAAMRMLLVGVAVDVEAVGIVEY